MKRFNRSKNRLLFGVAGGLGELLNIEAQFVRMGLVVIGIFLLIWWPFAAILEVIAYFVLAFFMPPPDRE